MNKTINVWHKDGIGEVEGTKYESVKIYENGALQNTDGQWRMLTVTMYSKEFDGGMTEIEMFKMPLQESEIKRAFN